MMLSVIIPVYNEERTIFALVEKVFKEPTKKEVIIINDGSFDSTSVCLEKIKAVYKRNNLIVYNKKNNEGKGSAVRKGFELARGNVVVIQDADLEYDPGDYKKLLKPIKDNKAMVVYGTRLKTLKLKLTGKDKTPFPLHYLVNQALSALTNILYGSKLTDMETCYKMMNREVYKSLNLVSNGFEIEPEITAKILKKGYKILEIPISTVPRSYKEGKKIKAIDVLWAINTLLKYWLCK